MRIVQLRASTLYGLCLTLGALGSGCAMDAGPDDPTADQATAVSAITINVNASYTLVGVQSGKCVAVQGASTASTAPIEIDTCTGTANQRFRPESAGGGFFRLHNELSGLCLDVSGASTADGAALLQFTCGTGTNQQFSFTDVAGGGERITARHSGKVLDVTARGTADGTRVEQFTSNGGANQAFVMTQALGAFAPDPE